MRACVCILIVFGHGTKHLGSGPIYDTSYLLVGFDLLTGFSVKRVENESCEKGNCAIVSCWYIFREVVSFKNFL